MNISFTGHRNFDREHFGEVLRDSILRLSNALPTTFWSGMASGFDLCAAEAVLEFRDAGADMKLNCVVPFLGQARGFSDLDYNRYESVLQRADRVEVLSQSYYAGVYAKRNDYLVEQADSIIAFFNGENRGGTAYTIRRARREGVIVENIYPQQQLSLF